MEFFNNLIYFVIELAHSPLMTTIDIDLLRDKFESRYIRTETNKILRNTAIDNKELLAEMKFVYIANNTCLI